MAKFSEIRIKILQNSIWEEVYIYQLGRGLNPAPFQSREHAIQYTLLAKKKIENYNFHFKFYNIIIVCTRVGVGLF